MLMYSGIPFFKIHHRNSSNKNEQNSSVLYVIKYDQSQMYNGKISFKGKMLCMAK